MAAMEAHAMHCLPVGWVRSSISEVGTAPKMEDEGGVAARIEIVPAYREGLLTLSPGQALVVLTWMHLASRETLQVHPRGDRSRPKRGVFNTRSPDRPNPIGLHEVTLLNILDDGLLVEPMEVVDGTPVVDIKPLRHTLQQAAQQASRP